MAEQKAVQPLTIEQIREDIGAGEDLLKNAGVKPEWLIFEVYQEVARLREMLFDRERGQ